MFGYHDWEDIAGVSCDELACNSGNARKWVDSAPLASSHMLQALQDSKHVPVQELQLQSTCQTHLEQVRAL